nr:cytochrome c-type biogenesis protein CcmF, mitochondrion [Tanacetum cinerariifolium]
MNGCKPRCSKTPSADHTERHESVGTGGLVFEPIGQTKTTSLIRLVLAACPKIGWNRKNGNRYRSRMRQKLVPHTVRRPSPTSAVRVRLRLTNIKKIQFTQRLHLGSELHMGKECCCLQDEWGVEYSESTGLVGKPKKSCDKEQSQNKEPEGKSKRDMDQILLP